MLFGFDNRYPYTDFHELNLDWILKVIRELQISMNTFVNVNTIKYADPILWNITTQYEQNTLVQDADGMTYLSKIPVPAGIAINNTDYWLKVADFSQLADLIKRSITSADDGASPISSENRDAGDMVWLNNELYEVLRTINVGDAYVDSGVNPNVQLTTVQDMYQITYDITDGSLIMNGKLINDDGSDAIDKMIIHGKTANIVDNQSHTDITNLQYDVSLLQGDVIRIDNDILNLQNDLSSAISSLAITTPEAYGAVGDGVTDDSAAFNDAFADHNTVYLKKNTSYYITAVSIPEGRQLIGQEGSVIICGAADTITCDNDITISGIEFQDDMAVYQDGSASVIQAVDKTGIHIEHCKFSDIHIACCIHLEHCSYCTVEHNLIDMYSYEGVMCTHGCSYIKINFNKILNGQGVFPSGNRYPIGLSGYSTSISNGPAHNMECKFNHIEDSSAYWEGIDSHGIIDSVISDNFIKNFWVGIALVNPGSLGYLAHNGDNLIIENNHIEDCVLHGIGVLVSTTGAEIRNIKINNNHVECYRDSTIESFQNSGICLQTGVKSSCIEICNNYITHNKNGIGIQTFDVDALKIDNNHIKAYGAATTYAIFMDLHTDFSNVEVTNNVSDSTSDFRGSTIHGSDLVHFDNNNFATSKMSNLDYTDAPRSSLPSATKSYGKVGDFVPCSANGTVAGWYCINSTHWLAVSGASV